MINGINKIAAIGGLGYLASPYSKFKPKPGSSDAYSHYDWAAKEVEVIAAQMYLSGMVVISPIASSHHIAKHLATLPEIDKAYVFSHEFWMPIDERLYDRCDYTVIVMLNSWEISSGMAMELGQVISSGKQVLFFDPSNNTLYNIDEAQIKYPDEFAAFMVLAAENMRPKYLQRTLSLQIGNLQKSILKFAGIKDNPPDEPEDDDGPGGVGA